MLEPIPLKLCVYKGLVKVQALNENLHSPELQAIPMLLSKRPHCE